MECMCICVKYNVMCVCIVCINCEGNYCKIGNFQGSGILNRERRCSVERNFRYRAHCLFEGVANVR